MAPVGKVPAASPSTYIESGTVASEMSGASVAPTIEPVAKMTAEFAPVSACAAASRSTLERTRASSEISVSCGHVDHRQFPPKGGRMQSGPY